MHPISAFFDSLGNSLTGSFLQDGALWALQNIPGFPPVIQTVHILGIAVIMGSIVLLNLRILKLAVPSQSLSEIARRVMPFFWFALASNLVSGAFFVFARPMRYFNNPVFLWKMAALLPIVILTFLYHQLSKREPDFWQLNPSRILVSRLIAFLSLTAVLLVCTGGRWIAYTEYLDYPLWYIEPYFDGTEFPFWVSVENWGISQIIAATNWFPTLETIHVIAASLLVGSILWVDLRLIGIAATAYPVSVLNRELIPWAWGAFTLATITGLGMFITRASGHLQNPAFQTKAILLTLAGANMAYFHFALNRNREQWNGETEPPRQAKTAGLMSLILWALVMLAGRWVGHIV